MVGRSESVSAHTTRTLLALWRRVKLGANVIVYAVVDDALSPDFPLGDAARGVHPA